MARYRLPALLAILLWVIWLVWGQPAIPEVVEPSRESLPVENAGISVSGIQGRDNALLLDPLAERSLSAFSPTLLGVAIVTPPISLAPSIPQPPPKPVAPLLPYVYLGHYRNADGVFIVYLRRGDEVVLAKPGTQLDADYRLEADIQQGLRFIYLPLKEVQLIPLGNLVP